jgi:RNA polymerase sigma factor (sigma-70 family)
MESTRGTTHFGRLLDRIRGGDPTAKDQLINDAYRRVHELAHFILRGQFPAMGRGLETDEVVSESLEKFTLKLREGLKRVPDNAAEMFAYVASIIRHVVLDQVRKRAGREFQTQFPSTEVPPDQQDLKGKTLGEDVLERLSVQEAVAKLPEHERRLIDLKFVWGMSDEELAAEDGCDPSTVRRRIRNILRKLRTTLEPPD